MFPHPRDVSFTPDQSLSCRKLAAGPLRPVKPCLFYLLSLIIHLLLSSWALRAQSRPMLLFLIPQQQHMMETPSLSFPAAAALWLAQTRPSVSRPRIVPKLRKPSIPSRTALPLLQLNRAVLLFSLLVTALQSLLFKALLRALR